jgi:NADH:ubiquinone oxidoreductase subunit E
LETEGDTQGKELSVRFNTCLGACAQAPVISVDHGLKGRMSPGVAGEIVAALLSVDQTSTDHNSAPRTHDAPNA